MVILAKGRWRVVECQVDLALGVRAMVFPADRAGPDAHDARCRHFVVEDTQEDLPVAAFRLFGMADGGEIGLSYSAGFYDLAGLSDFGRPMVELGRFCLRPGHGDPEILRLAWGALTRIVDDGGVEMLFGCASFQGTAPEAHAHAFAMLHDRHLAPAGRMPKVGASRVVGLADHHPRPFDPKRAHSGLPPILRTYLTMGGWVSDHAVVDEAMGTIHVFTGVEVSAIPPARRRLLRTVAA